MYPTDLKLKRQVMEVNIMNICVFGTAENMSANVMLTAKKLGEWIADNKYGLVFGGFGDGLLGIVAENAAIGAKEVIGVFPEQQRKGHLNFNKCTKILHSDDKRTRKKMQAENADLFVVLPYGIGVMDELFEVLLLKSYGEIKGKVFIMNIDHCYDSLQHLLEDQGGIELCDFVCSVEEIEKHIN